MFNILFIVLLNVFSVVHESSASEQTNSERVVGVKRKLTPSISELGTPPKKVNRRIPGGKNSFFTYNYINDMKFKDGDLIFGLQKAREHTISAIKIFKNNPHYVCTVDQFNNILLNHSNLSYDFSSEIEEIAATAQDLSASDRSRLVRYAQLLIHPYFTSYHLRQTITEEEKWVQRACKAAIYFARTEDNVIHFILDGLDIKKALKSSDRNYKSFTSIELRSIFKRWLLDVSILDSVVFYQGGKRLETPAPWLDSNRNLTRYWKRYVKSKDWDSLVDSHHLKPKVLFNELH